MKSLIILAAALNTSAYAWVSPKASYSSTSTELSMSTTSLGGLHGENSCFLPLEQVDEEHYAPRIVQVCRCISYVKF